jgi:LysM repeat protein
MNEIGSRPGNSRHNIESSRIGKATFIALLFSLGWLLVAMGRLRLLPILSAPVWGSKPLLGYFALTASLSEPMQQGAGLTDTQMSQAQEVAHREMSDLRLIEQESRLIIEDPRLTPEEKRELIFRMGFNARVDQVVRESSRALESTLGAPAFRRLVRWIEQRWTIERYLHGVQRAPFAITGAVTDYHSFPRLPVDSLYKSPTFQRTFKIFATHYDSKGAYYVALPDQCLKLTNGGLKTCESKGYVVGKEYSVYLTYKKKGAAARVGEADDNYWATLYDPTPRRMFADLALGMPEAQAAYFNGYNGGLDQYGRKVTGPYGVDVSRKVGDDIGLKWGVNDWVSISYLWTADWGSKGDNPPPDSGNTNPPDLTGTPIQTLASVQSVKLNTPDAEGRIVHQVQPGETLWSIAVAYQVSLQSLYTMNNLTEQSVIMPGQKLTVRLPGSNPTATPTESLTPTPNQRPSSTPRPTKTSLSTLTSNSTLTSSTGSVTLNNGTESRISTFLKDNSLLGVILLFLVLGALLIVIGRWLGSRSTARTPKP